ncbi:MAG: glycoside hydrolase 43 family protein [Candidatus Hydrogenedentota bacterium]
MSKKYVVFCLFFALLLNVSIGEPVAAQETDSRAQNPIIWADVPDPSVIRVDDAYYMTSTTMHMNPGLPIMKSTDLVNWETIGYAYETLTDNDAMNLANGENAYGEGSWASTVRYHDEMFYISTFSYTTNQTHIYKTNDIEDGVWTEFAFSPLYHDNSIFFEEDGGVYLVYGVGDIMLVELASDLRGPKPEGIEQVIIPDAGQIAGSEFIVPAEGAHIHKVDGMYYVFLITWPRNRGRTQIVYRSDSLTGPYEGRVVLDDSGIAQGGIFDTPEGDWYAMLFQDHGAVGRIPHLIPVTWEDEWPVLGDNGQAPTELDISAANKRTNGIMASDDFVYDGEDELALVWQWNHNPDGDYWSVTDRPGYLRLVNDRVDSDIHDTRNTLTQRTFGPECSGEVALDTANMKDGDYAGLAAFQNQYGFVGVKQSDSSRSVIMVDGSSGAPEEVESLPLKQDEVRLRIDFHFHDREDRAYFYYSLDGDNWSRIGDSLQMSYTLDHFMGYRFALFNYGTKTTGGFVDFEYFEVADEIAEVEREG